MATKKGKIDTSFKLTRAAWRTLMLNKELVWLSILTVAVQAVILVGYILVGIFVVPQVFPGVEEADTLSWQYYVLLAVYLFSMYFVANIYSGALSHAALQRFRGDRPTLGLALKASRKKMGVLFQFTALQATVGLVLNMLADRLPMAGKIATILAGTTWSIATMFALPVIMDNRETKPLSVVNASAKTFLSVWAESVFIGISLSAISTIVSAALLFGVFGFFGFGFALENNVLITLGVIAFVSLIIAVVIISFIMSTLKQIAMTAAYYYATTQQIPAGFDNELVRGMFRPKKKWLA